jgi:hypothetical protein
MLKPPYKGENKEPGFPKEYEAIPGSWNTYNKMLRKFLVAL